ncbi:MAG: KpsF/GutQ family sugar-phosphate isomerase [Saprospiraceae bacterium]|nr:KpsF/GutQ family sugar-phosphate isomerase [Saprospiraceae bacterium]
MDNHHLDSDKLLKLARETIQIEERTLAALRDSLDQAFIDALQQMVDTKGRIVVTGIGKSALIGNKIVATLNSTGTPALFMHAGDAIHGDIGMLLQDDVLMCLSKSGGTAEVKALVPLVKAKGNLIIAIVAHRDSYLGQQADIVIHTPVEKEADPHDLAPTASAMGQLAVGDALAVCLFHINGFEKSDFAHLHPGGTLGKKLYMRVSDIYPMHEAPQVFLDSAVKEVILEISSKRLGATAVVNENSEVVGIITDGDLRRMLERSSDITVLKAGDIMTRNPKYVAPEDLAVKAVGIMRENSITQLLVILDDRYLGIIHIHDLLREGLL